VSHEHVTQDAVMASEMEQLPDLAGLFLSRRAEPQRLVVSPYNMQVNLLQQVLPAGARVGTADKFQGQEAAVVIVSPHLRSRVSTFR
jgi:hypothetical protein